MKKIIIIISALFFSCKMIAQPGSIDATFGVTTGLNVQVKAIAIQPDGKVIVGGWFTTFNGTSRNGVARLNADGSLDNTFNPGTGFTTGSTVRVHSLLLQPDGKIIVGGQFNDFNGTSRNNIARLNSDGSIDITFNPGTGFNNGVYALALQPDGKIIVGGIFTAFNSITGLNSILRLNSDGSWDNTFSASTFLNDDVYAIVLQPDGKVIAGGNFTSYNGTSRNCIVRINSNGSLDATFNPGSGFAFNSGPVIYSLALQSDGKILAGGIFTSYNGTARKYIARISDTGSLDATFNTTGAGFSGSINTIIIQPNGKIITGGGFATYNGIDRDHIAMLTSTGTLDATFDPGTGFADNGTVYALAQQSDWKIIAGGDFATYNGTSRLYIARILNIPSDITINSITPGSLCAGNSINVNYTCIGFTPSGNLNVELSDAAGSFASPVVIATVASSQTGIISAAIPSNTLAGNGYRVRLVATTSIVTGTDAGTFTVYALPSAPTITLNGVNLESDMVSGNEWYYEGLPINGATNQTYAPTQNGYYYVLFTDNNGCEAASDSINMLSVGVYESSEYNFSVSPNPAINELTIKTDNPTKTDYIIFDITGRIMSTGSFNQNTTISINDFAQGNYFIQLTSNQSTTTQKFIKQ